MDTVLVDGKWLTAGLPAGFEAIPQHELQTLMSIEYDCMWGARNTTQHMLISVVWKDSGKLLAKLASEKSLAQRVDKTFAKRYRKGGYSCGGYFTREVCGASGQAHGFGFSYTVEGIAQSGEVLVFKRGIRCYTLTYYTRTDLAASNRSMYEHIIESLEAH